MILDKTVFVSENIFLRLNFYKRLQIKLAINQANKQNQSAGFNIVCCLLISVTNYD